MRFGSVRLAIVNGVNSADVASVVTQSPRFAVSIIACRKPA
jgi:hypothetical protein